MKTRKLGSSGIDVSVLCLGTMTWGSQNSAAEAHAQIEAALGEGVNFIDTAEMYPTTPRRAETTGRTEEIVGQWMGANKGRRADIVLATKITGEGNRDIRDGARVTGAMIREALEQSLRRLQTEYVDLYQLHWPNRGSYHFRKLWRYDPATLEVGDMDAEILDMLGEVDRLREEGKLRAFGLSNETAWGMTQFAKVAEREGLPGPVSIQNEYSLLCRLFDLDAAETAIMENIGLLAYSPLAAGLLTGKYAAGDVPEGSRLSLQQDLNGRVNEISKAAVDAYCGIASDHGLEPNHLALAYAVSKSFMTSVIIGATSQDQLMSNLAAHRIELPGEAIAAIEAVHRRFPMPI